MKHYMYRVLACRKGEWLPVIRYSGDQVTHKTLEEALNVRDIISLELTPKIQRAEYGDWEDIEE